MLQEDRCGWPVLVEVVDCQRAVRLNGAATYLLVGISPLAADKALCLEIMMINVNYPCAAMQDAAYRVVKVQTQGSDESQSEAARQGTQLNHVTKPFSPFNCFKQNIQIKIIS